MEARERDRRLDAFFCSLDEDLNEHIQTGSDKPVEVRAALLRLRDRSRKRAKYHRPELDKKAKEAFKLLNSSLSNHRVPDCVASEAALFIRVTLENYTTSVGCPWIQETLWLDHFFSLWRFGPGASLGVKDTHCVEKISQPMTCTQSAVPWVLRLRRLNPYFRVFDSLMKMGHRVVPGSRLETVPKNADTNRTIAIEPSGNMALQLAAGSYLEGALRFIGLDITEQEPKNKVLACTGSIDDSFATIDLKSASDMFTPSLIEQLFPREWFRLFMDLRSPSTEIDGEQVGLNMMSTMGNGFTFPLMTLTIVSLIYALRRLSGGPRFFVDWRVTAVYGDDIIVPVSEYDEVCSLLCQAGLIVNHDKSYRSGPFRESCGGDFNNGVLITPFYVEDLSTSPSIYVAINKVLDWCERFVFLPRSLAYLFKLLDRVDLVPEWSSPDSGVQTSDCPRKYTYLQRPRKDSVLRERRRDGTLNMSYFFAVMLVSGGYITSGQGNALLYTPRPRGRDAKVSWVRRHGRLPRGYLSGWDPSTRNLIQSKSRALLVNLLLVS